MAFGLPSGAQPNFPGTQNIIYENAFRKRFRDKSILPLITNRKWEGRFKGKGTEIEVPVLPLIHTTKTKMGDKIQYQTPKSTMEKFVIDRERYFALKFEDEDRLFSAFDIQSPILAEGATQMAEDVEEEFLSDIYTKVHKCNQGANAGFRSQSYNLGTSGAPVTLTKADAVDYISKCAAAMSEMPGGQDAKFWCVIPTAVAQRLQTSELKMANWMGDAKSVLRGSVNVLGELCGMTIYVDNKLPMWISNANSANNVYNILFGDDSAVSFAEEVSIKDKLQDKDEWGDFHRSKMIYDWFVRYPERIGTGFVKIG